MHLKFRLKKSVNYTMKYNIIQLPTTEKCASFPLFIDTKKVSSVVMHLACICYISNVNLSHGN